MSDTTANVDVYSSVRAAISNLLLHRVHGKPGEFWLTSEGHEIVEMTQIFWMIGKPSKCMQGGIPSILKDCVDLICRILIIGLPKEGRHRLVLCRDGPKTEQTRNSQLQEGRAFVDWPLTY